MTYKNSHVKEVTTYGWYEKGGRVNERYSHELILLVLLKYAKSDHLGLIALVSLEECSLKRT